MTSHSARLPVHNQKAVPHVVSVEPWGADYTLLPGESLEVIAFGDDLAPSFELVEWEDESQVYCNETLTYEVVQGGVALQCGHNRRPAAA